MTEIIAATCRALACDVRLVALYHLRLGGELSASELAARTGLPLDWLSNHLARLVAPRLVYRRRSGGRVLHRLAISPPPSLRFNPLPALHQALNEPEWATRGWDEEGVLHLTSPVVASLDMRERRALDVVFDAATAFANVRRLQIVRLLTQGRPCKAEAIVGELRMSPAACTRHVDKLLRRGYLRRAGEAVWTLSDEARTPFHGALLAEVKGALARWPISELINSEMDQDQSIATASDDPARPASPLAGGRSAAPEPGRDASHRGAPSPDPPPSRDARNPYQPREM